MSQDQEPLDSAKHEEILKKKILTAPEFTNVTQQSSPKAIILAGQPGAGKGGLADTAQNELGKNAVTVDPDELRRYHPDVDAFRQAHPYTWSGQTHADASKWPDKLLDATITSKKNIKIDTATTTGRSDLNPCHQL